MQEHKLLLLYKCDEWKRPELSLLIGAIDTANPYWKSLLLLTLRTLHDNDYIELNEPNFLSDSGTFEALANTHTFLSTLDNAVKYLYVATISTNDIRLIK